MKNLLIIAMAFFFAGAFGTIEAQQVEDLKKERDEIVARQDVDSKRLVDLENQIAKLDADGWRFGGVGNVAGSLAGFNDWNFGQAFEDNINILADVSVYGNYNADKYFWRNGASLRIGYQKFDSDEDWNNTIDELLISSLAGYKFSEEMALSGLLDIRTTWGSLFDPAYVSLGAGITYTPHPNLAVVFHPLTAQGVFVASEELRPIFTGDVDKSVKFDLGAKLVVDYAHSNLFIPGLTYTGRLDAFMPYAATNVFNVVTQTLEEKRDMQVTITNKFGYAISKYINLTAGIDFRMYRPEFDGWQERHLLGIGLTTTF